LPSRFKTPHVSTLVTGCSRRHRGRISTRPAGGPYFHGILLRFAVVCLGVLVLRYTRPDAHRPFRVPWAPVTCVLGTVVCLGMTAFLSAATWKRLVIWTAVGMSIYAFLRIPAQPPAPMTGTLPGTPAADGFRMPGEFEPHTGCWMLCRSGPTTGARRRGRRSWRSLQVAAAIAQFEPLTVGGVDPALQRRAGTAPRARAGGGDGAR